MSSSGVRSRFISDKSAFVPKGSLAYFKEESPASESEQYKGVQLTESESHTRGKDGSFHEGGPFYTARTKIYVPYLHVDLKSQYYYGWTYKGPIYTPPPALIRTPLDLYKYRPKDTSDLDPYGAEAISFVSPGVPSNELSEQLIEQKRDGLPSLPGVSSWKERANAVKAAGSEYLNTVFGWRPLVEEIVSFAHIVSHSHGIIKQYQEGAGGNTHEEFHFPIEINTESETRESIRPEFPGFSTNWFDDVSVQGTMQIDTTDTIRRWFSGSFTYPDLSATDSVDSMDGHARNAEVLLGTKLTPDSLWELAPWSWAVDWFSDTGDIIQNASNFAELGLIMRYGYMMEEHSTNTTHRIPPPYQIHGVEGLVPPCEIFTISKVRRPANPFGFGVHWPELSPEHVLVALALGITVLL